MSEKVHATIPKGIVGSFELSLLQRNLKEWHEMPMDVCFANAKGKQQYRRFDSFGVRNSVLIISHITFRYCRVHIFQTTFLEIAVSLGKQTPYIFSKFNLLNSDITFSTSFPGSLSYPSRDPGLVWSPVSQNLGDYKQRIRGGGG